MKTVVLLLAVMGSLGLLSYGQQTTNTHCTVYGNSADCTSNTTDYGAQQQRAYEQGQAVGNAIGQGLAGLIHRNSFSKGLKKYCAAHPGEVWKYGYKQTGSVLSSGTCPTDEENAAATANEFAANHKDFIRSSANAERMTAYIQEHRLDPRERKSYERAYTELKKAGQLELYAK